MALSDSQAGGSPQPTPSPTLGRYKILRVIARSNDVVYEAIDPGINRRVAVKELALSPNLSGQQRRERIERFYREAKAAGNLSHPNIVTVYEVGHDGDRHYIAMEYLEGPSLRDILRMRTALSTKEALNVALQLCDALGYAHGQGVVHRDVKPDNVHLVVPNDVVKLTDFGIARILADPAITSTGQVFGTPSYMSPEQIMSKEVDHRTDIFSLGVVLYEMIVGKKPFTGDSVITITYHIMNSQPVIPNTLPSGVYNIISRSLTKDPSQRYLNMASMAADLHAEIAFSDSPYQRTFPPGNMTFHDISEEQTAMVNRGELPRTIPPPPPRSGAYAPPTGIASAVTGGAVAPATSVTPMPVPQALPQQSANSGGTFALIGSVIGVMALIVVVAFVVGKAYHANQVALQDQQALVYYNRATSEMSLGDRNSAVNDLTKALQEASPGSQVATNASLALSQLTSTAPIPNSVLQDNTQPTIPTGPTSTAVPGLPGAATGATGTSTPATIPTLPGATPIATGPQAAASYLQAANSDIAGNDQTDAIAQLENAASADPVGDSGKKAGSELAQILNQQASSAVQSGQIKTALDDWQLILKYAPTDPAADHATLMINQYSPSAGSGATSGATAPSDQAPAPSTP